MTTPAKRNDGEQFSLIESEVIDSPPRPDTAQTVLRLVMDHFKDQGIPVTSKARGMIGKQAKELLEDGFDTQTLVVAAVVAVRRGEPQNMHFVASDLVMARAGQRMSRQEYERMLRDEMEIGGFRE